MTGREPILAQKSGQHADWYIKWINRESEPRKYNCDECGPTIEGSVCEATKEVHIDPKRRGDHTRWIRDALRNRPHTSPDVFRKVAKITIERCGEEAIRVIDELASRISKDRLHPSTTAVDYDRFEQIVRKVYTEEKAPVLQQVFNKVEAARFLRICVSELDKLRRLGLIKKSGSSRRVTFTLAELLRYLHESPGA